MFIIFVIEKLYLECFYYYYYYHIIYLTIKKPDNLNTNIQLIIILDLNKI